MRRIALAALAIVFLCLGAASTAVAQEEEPSNDTVQLAFWKCDWAEFQNFGQLVDSVYTPIAQETGQRGQVLGQESRLCAIRLRRERCPPDFH